MVSLSVMCICYSGQWVGHIPAYQLRFADGQEPERVYWDDDVPSSNAMSYRSSRSSLQQPPVRELSLHCCTYNAGS